MTLRDLLDRLTDVADEYGDDVEVRLAIQPSWPFEHSIRDVEVVDPADAEDDEEAEAADENDEPVVVYIAEGRQLGYLPGTASRALGWRG